MYICVADMGKQVRVRESGMVGKWERWQWRNIDESKKNQYITALH